MVTRKRATRLIAPNGSAPPTQAPPMDPGDVRSPLESDRPSPISAGEQDSLMDLLSGFTDAAEVSVKVYRVIKNKPLAYVYECSPETFSMDALRDDYGGGEFRVYIHRAGELLKNVRVMVEPPRRQGGVSPELEAMMSSLRERQDKTDKLLEALAGRVMSPAPAAPSLGDTLARMDLPAVIGAVGSLMALMKPPPAPPAPPPAPAPDPMAGVEMFMKAFELARELKGDGGGETSLLDVVRDLFKSPLLAQAVQAAATEQPQPGHQPPPRQLPPPGGLRRPPLGVPPGQPINTPMGPVIQPPTPPMPQHHAPSAEEVSHAKLSAEAGQAVIMQQMAFLCEQAANNADPELYAGLILDRLDDDTLLEILEWTPDPVSALIDKYPPAAPYRDWFQQVVEYIAMAFEADPDSPEAGTGGEGGNGLELGSPHDVGGPDALGPETPLPVGGLALG